MRRRGLEQMGVVEAARLTKKRSNMRGGHASNSLGPPIDPFISHLCEKRARLDVVEGRTPSFCDAADIVRSADQGNDRGECRRRSI
jgi:hypothetical protein